MPEAADAVAPASWPCGMQELAPGVFAYVQEGGGLCIANAGVIIGDDDCIIIDPLFVASMTQALIDAVRSVTDKPVRTVINTHHHIDHTLGNSFFPDAVIISQRRARGHIEANGIPARLKEMAPHFADEIDAAPGIRLPSLTFDEELTLYCGRHEVRLRHFGVGHTEDDVVVHLPADGILFAGDLAFHYVTPLAVEGDVENWIRVTRRIEEMAPHILAPGHGPVGDLGNLAQERAYLERLMEWAREAHTAGWSGVEAAQTMDLGPYASWTEPERLVPNMLRALQGLADTLEQPLDPGWPIAMAAWTQRPDEPSQ